MQQPTPPDPDAPQEAAEPEAPLTAEEWIAQSLIDMQELARHPERLYERKRRIF